MFHQGAEKQHPSHVENVMEDEGLFCLVLVTQPHCEILLTSCLDFAGWFRFNHFLHNTAQATEKCSLVMLWGHVSPFYTKESVHIFFGFDGSIVR